MRWVSQGASVFRGCTMTNVDLPEHGNLGYPCPHGSAVQLQVVTQTGHALNCVLFYYPIGLLAQSGKPRSGLERLRNHYKAGLKAVLAGHSRLTDPDSPDRIRLNDIAADFSRGMLSRGKDVYPAAFRFKVVLVLPVYEDIPGRSHQRGMIREWLSASAGLAAAGGQFMVDHVHVPAKLDLNEPPGPGPLVLYIIAVLPEVTQSDTINLPCLHCPP